MEAAGRGGGVPLPQETKAQVQRERPCQGECCHLAQPGRQQSGRGVPSSTPGPTPAGYLDSKRWGPHPKARVSSSSPIANERHVSSTGEQRLKPRAVGGGASPPIHKLQAKVLGPLLASPGC